MDIDLFYRYKQDPGLLQRELKSLAQELGRKPLVIIDEIQKMPRLTDTCQILIDEDIAIFVITSSSARKIKNLLPGRVILFKLSTMMFSEYQKPRELENVLINGFLPRICAETDQSIIEQELQTYVSVYLEEEIRKEALVRHLGSFVNFLRLASIESGNIINVSAISQELGVSYKTVQEYYRILEDCLLVRRIEPLVTGENSRRRLSRGIRYIIFDLGLRRVGAKEGIHPTLKQQGNLLEQYVGIELSTWIENNDRQVRLLFWRDHNGPEVDYVLEKEGLYIPIEVKLKKNPSEKDIKHLKVFREEYPVKKSYVVANVDQAYELEEGIEVIPWNQLGRIIEEIRS